MVELILETITPVHVGTGHKYSGAEFVLKDKTLYRVSLDKLLKKLTLEQIDDLTERLEDRNFSLTDFLNDKNIALSEIKRYASGFEGPRTPREIAEHIKTNNRAYIPGSSIKGIIRGALLWHATKNKMDELIGVISRDMERIKRQDLKKRIGMGFVEDIFRVDDKTKKQNMNYDAKYDLLKFLEVADFMPVDYNLNIEDVKTYSLKKEGYFGNWTIIRGDKKFLNQFVESISKKGIFKGTIKLSPQIKEVLKNEVEYPLLKEKLHILGLKSDLNEADMINHLIEVIGEFNEWCLSKEIELCRKANNAKEFLNELEGLGRQNKTESLIRIGFGSGTIYQTLIKRIEEEDVGIAQNIVNEVPLGKNKRKIDFKTNKNLYPPYPKTLEFTRTNKPLGWLRLRREM